jgi:hypothetical protein
LNNRKKGGENRYDSNLVYNYFVRRCCGGHFFGVVRPGENEQLNHHRRFD